MGLQNCRWYSTCILYLACCLAGDRYTCAELPQTNQLLDLEDARAGWDRLESALLKIKAEAAYVADLKTNDNPPFQATWHVNGNGIDARSERVVAGQSDPSIISCTNAEYAFAFRPK